jgi:hypothetical protein
MGEKLGQLEKRVKRIMTAEMKFRRRTAKGAWRDYKTIDDSLSELIINPVVKKIQNYIHKWIKHVRRMDGNRQTAKLNCKKSAISETTSRTILKRLIHF